MKLIAKAAFSVWLLAICFAIWGFGGPSDPSDIVLKWQDLRVSLLSTNAAGSNPPGLVKVLATGSSQGVFCFAFDRNTEEELYTSVQMPHGFAKTVIDPHIHWQPTDTSVATVVWAMEYVIQNFDQVGSPASEIIRAVQVSGGTARKHQIAAFPDIDVSWVKDSAIILVRIFREAGNPLDTYNADAVATDLDFHYQLRAPAESSVGSNQEYGDN